MTINTKKEISEINNLLYILIKYCETNIKTEEIEIMYPLLKIIFDKIDILDYSINSQDNK